MATREEIITRLIAIVHDEDVEVVLDVLIGLTADIYLQHVSGGSRERFLDGARHAFDAMDELRKTKGVAN